MIGSPGIPFRASGETINVRRWLVKENIDVDRYFNEIYKIRMKLLTTAEAAERLGVHRTRVHVLIKEGRLPAERFGRAYMIMERDLKLVMDRKPGRPSQKATRKQKVRKDMKK